MPSPMGTHPRQEYPWPSGREVSWIAAAWRERVMETVLGKDLRPTVDPSVFIGWV